VRQRFRVVLLLAFVVVAICASAQDVSSQKNEVSAIFGRTFVNDVDVKSVPQDLNVGENFTFEVNYARRIRDLNRVALRIEVPLVIDPAQRLNYLTHVVPKNYSAYFLTPALRANLFPNKVLSPWASLGLGFAHFDPNSMLLYYGVNPNKTANTVAALQVGFGLDVKLTRHFSLRTAWRDFYSGTPHLNLDTGSRRNNYFIGGGGIFHF
jgi:hypothetical protein